MQNRRCYLVIEALVFTLKRTCCQSRLPNTYMLSLSIRNVVCVSLSVPLIAVHYDWDLFKVHALLFP